MDPLHFRIRESFHAGKYEGRLIAAVGLGLVRPARVDDGSGSIKDYSYLGWAFRNAERLVVRVQDRGDEFVDRKGIEDLKAKIRPYFRVLNDFVVQAQCRSCKEPNPRKVLCYEDRKEKLLLLNELYCDEACYGASNLETITNGSVISDNRRLKDIGFDILHSISGRGEKKKVNEMLRELSGYRRGKEDLVHAVWSYMGRLASSYNERHGLRAPPKPKPKSGKQTQLPFPGENS